MKITLALDGIVLFESGDRAHTRDAVRAVAAAYCGMMDDEQAQFFEEVGKVFESWGINGDSQAYYIGRHMNNCSCITYVGRDVLRAICKAMELPPERHD